MADDQGGRSMHIRDIFTGLESVAGFTVESLVTRTSTTGDEQ